MHADDRMAAQLQQDEASNLADTTMLHIHKRFEYLMAHLLLE